MTITETINVFPKILLSDFLRYFITAGTAYFFFWVIFKNKWEHRIIQQKTLKVRKLFFEFRYSMSTVLIFALIGWCIVTADSNGYTLIYKHVYDYGLIWFFVSIGLMIILHDAWFYWTHRLMHHPRIFKYVHLVHHRSTNPSPWAAYSFHPVEAIVEAAIFPIIVFTFPVHHLALFIFLLYMIVRNVHGHLGIEIFPKSFISNKFINWHTSTTHHDLHHKNFKSNYGLYFTWWDRWMGTEHTEYKKIFEELTSRKGTTIKNKGLARKHPKITSSLKNKVRLFMIGLLIMNNISPGKSQSVIGLWQTYHDETTLPLSLISIDSTSKGITGKVEQIFLQPWEGTDPICYKCEGRFKNRKVIGMKFLWNFQERDNEWTGGQILDPVEGKTYNAKIWMESDSVLRVRGYSGPLNLFYRSQTWILEHSDNDDLPITGRWISTDDQSGLPKSLVSLSIQDRKLSGRIEEVFLMPWEGTDPICKACPAELSGLKIVGLNILSEFEKDTESDRKWINGKILDPGNGKTYKSTIWLENENTLKIRGYLGPFYRTQTWRRIDTLSSIKDSSP